MLGLSEPNARSRTRTRMAKKGQKEDCKKEREEEGEEMKTLIALIGRVSLGASSRADAACGMLLDVMIMTEATQNEKGESMSLAIKDKMREFNEMVKGASKEDKEQLGPPHVRAWGGLLSWTQHLPGEGLKKALQEHATEVKDMRPEERAVAIGSAVKYCRLSKASKQGAVKLECRVQEAAECSSAAKTWKALRWTLMKMKSTEVKQGKAPQGALQRKCVEKMKQLGMLKEDDRMKED
eukprot:TRINITY_DN63342_c0_g1_i1.p2 TRINITY_DN63342_c0_g1~~TRINITY_DN63342_c0_g1_i1.p2  ORF type:complete len:238 (-),score=90.55 TRINITY_DN63342_c0_g1_i1:85-798(-)